MMKRILLLAVLSIVTVTAQAKLKTSQEGVDVYSNHTNIQNGSEFRTQSISADITGNLLTITFNENVGIAHIVIKDSNGVYIDRENVFSTPDYATFTINDAENDNNPSN